MDFFGFQNDQAFRLQMSYAPIRDTKGSSTIASLPSVVLSVSRPSASFASICYLRLIGSESKKRSRIEQTLINVSQQNDYLSMCFVGLSVAVSSFGNRYWVNLNFWTKYWAHFAMHYVKSLQQPPFVTNSNLIETTSWVPITVTISQSNPFTTLPDTTTSMASNPFDTTAPSSVGIHLNDCTAYKFTVAVLSSILGISILLLTIVFCYVKPKKWKRKGKAEANGQTGQELQELKKERDEWKGRYEILRGLPS